MHSCVERLLVIVGVRPVPTLTSIVAVTVQPESVLAVSVTRPVPDAPHCTVILLVPLPEVTDPPPPVTFH